MDNARDDSQKDLSTARIGVKFSGIDNDKIKIILKKVYKIYNLY